MDSEIVVDLIKFFGVVFGAVISIWKIADKIAEVMINTSKQKSVGAEAIREIRINEERLQKDIEILKEERLGDMKQINKLQNDLEILMDRIWKLLTK